MFYTTPFTIKYSASSICRIVGIIALLFTSINCHSFTQASADTVLANRFFAKGDTLLRNGKYDSSILFYQKALKIYNQAQLWYKYINCYNKIAQNQWRSSKIEESIQTSKQTLALSHELLGKDHVLEATTHASLSIAYMDGGDYDQAIQSINEALRIRRVNLGEDEIGMAHFYHNLGNIYYYKDDFDLALENYNKALKIRLDNPEGEELNISATYNNIGGIHYLKEEYDLALHQFQKSLELQQSIVGESHPQIAGSIGNIALVHESAGNYDLALKYYLKALDMKEETLGGRHLKVAESHYNLGQYYVLRGSYEQAIWHHENALRIWKEIHTDDHQDLADAYSAIGDMYFQFAAYDKALAYQKQSERIYNNIGLEVSQGNANILMAMGRLYFERRLYDLSLKYQSKALEILVQVLGKDHSVISQVYNELGKIYSSKSDFQEALAYYELSLKNRSTNQGEDHIRNAETYSNIGDMFLMQKDYDKSLKNHSRALSIRRMNLGEKNPDVAASYNSLGDVYRTMGNLSLAMNNYQQALVANVVDFEDKNTEANPALKNYLDQVTLLNSLRHKAQIFRRLYDSSRYLDDLKYADQTFTLCDSLISKIRQSRGRYKDKISLGKTSLEIYRESVSSSMLLYEKTNDKFYLEQALSLVEKSKASVLSLNLSEVYAKNFADLPDSLLSLENKLKEDKTFYQSLILNLQTAREPYDTTKLTRYEDRYFEISNQLDSLSTVFETCYPRYHDLKYQNAILSTDEIQRKLQSDQALIEYFEGDSSILIFTITKDKLSVHEVLISSKLENTIDDYISSLDFGFVNRNPEQAFDKFTQYSNTIYNELLKPALEDLSNIKQLTVIPAGKMAYVPWDILLTEPAGTSEKLNYRELSYLFNDYSISYAYSSSILLRKDYLKSKKPSSNILAFAAEYSIDVPPSDELAVYSTFRDHIVPLEWNKKEINEISQHFEGSFLSGDAASEKAFKTEAGNYKVLHLAMHAFVDNQDPMLSKLVFSQAQDSIEDGMLHAYELFNMNLAAEMVVLSACNTGIGPVKQGEGIMSLGRAFAYAGCPSVVMSHWSVNDLSTSKLMGRFYEGLSQGKSKDEAMQQAKATFLKEANEIEQHPLYWGGFVVMGNTDSLSQSDDLVNYLIYGLVVLILIALGITIVIRKRRSAQ